MAKVYKLCDAGHMSIFDEQDAAPRKCAQCGRNILQKDIFPLEEYEERSKEQEKKAEGQQKGSEEKPPAAALLKLVNAEKGIGIILPDKEDFIIGREGVGAEVFGDTVSRKHLYVTPVGRVGISVTDKESLNGTKVNGEVLPKGTAKVVTPGSTITLDINETGITLTLQRIE